MDENKITVNGLDLVDCINILDEKSRSYERLILDTLERTISPSKPEYKLIRKVVLDNFNEYTRSVLRLLFGDIEGNKYKE